MVEVVAAGSVVVAAVEAGAVVVEVEGVVDGAPWRVQATTERARTRNLARDTDDSVSEAQGNLKTVVRVRRVRRLTHLQRWFDFSLPSNRYVFIASGIAGVAMFGWRVSQDPVGAAAGAGLNTAMTAFLSWVLARELDPDRTITAAWALPAGATVTAFLGAGALLPLYLLAMTSRLLARTTGLPPTTPDLIFNGLVAVVAARHTAGWAVGLAFAFALARDAGLSNPAPRRQMVWSLGVAAAVTAVATWQGLEFSAPPAPAVSIALAGLIAGWTLPVESPNSVADLTFFPLDGYRLRSARRTALAALVLAGLTGGGEGLVPLAPGWLTLLATGVISRLRTADRP